MRIAIATPAVADADRRRQRRRQSLEVVEVTRVVGVVVLAAGDVDRMLEAAHLDEQQAQGDE
jgi:hypothetical protein